MKKKILLAFLVCGLILTTGCGKKEEVSNNNDKDNTVEKTNVEIKNNMFYVNGNKVDFYSVSDAAQNYDYVNENDIYNGPSSEASYIYYIIDDVVFVEFSPASVAYENEYYFIDRSGKIIKKVNGINADIKLSINTSIIQKVEQREDNTIYFTLNNSDIAFNSECAVCDRIAKGEQNEIAVYVDKITYLGNGEFKLDKAAEIMTYEEYADSHPSIDINSCSTCD